jgi:hypothetical protein
VDRDCRKDAVFLWRADSSRSDFLLVDYLVENYGDEQTE